MSHTRLGRQRLARHVGNPTISFFFASSRCGAAVWARRSPILDLLHADVHHGNRLLSRGMTSSVQLQLLIVDQLAQGEMELLRLVVAVRRTLGKLESPKGDLAAMVKSALRTLVASKVVVDHDGRYSLSPPK